MEVRFCPLLHTQKGLSMHQIVKAVLQGLPEGPVRVRVWHPDQLVDGAPTPLQLRAGANTASIATQIVSARKRREAPAADPNYPGL